MIKKNWIYLLFGFSVILFAAGRFARKPEQQHTGEIQLSLKTFKGDAGWGYDVYTNDTLYIHQEFIPAAEGRKGFAAKEDADKIGRLAMAKLKYSKLPVITLAEIDSCGVTR